MKVSQERFLSCKTARSGVLLVWGLVGAVLATEGKGSVEIAGTKLGRLQGATRPHVVFSQLGYQPDDKKIVTVIDNGDAQNCELVDGGKRVVARVPLLQLPSHPDYPWILKSCDLSEVTALGSYTLKVGGSEETHPFFVTAEPWRELLPASNKSFYFQRASVALSAAHAGPWARLAGHPDRQLRIRIEGEQGPERRKDVPGGWYDAGDYGKYMVNAGIAVATLLMQAERFAVASSDDLNIPESHNGISDLLDEIRYELDWILTMQDSDGGAFFKVGTRQWAGFVLPHLDTGERLIIGKSTTSTLNFAAATAHASRIYAPLDPHYAARLKEAAEAAWRWAREHPYVTEPHNDGGGTGTYNDNSFGDEFLWAASQLAQVSSSSEYRDYINQQLSQTSLRQEGREALWWQNTLSMAYLSLVRSHVVDGKLRSHVENEIVAYAARARDKAAREPFGIPYRENDFIWGSNGGLSNVGMILMEAYRLTRDEGFRDCAKNIVHYLLGHNAHALSFVTGYGFRSAQFPHHRPSGGDGVAAPIPGFVVGGPNYERQDVVDGVVYPAFRSGALSYVDTQPSFSSNEVAINWSAPFSYLLAALLESQKS
jgi:endoglucanase